MTLEDVKKALDSNPNLTDEVRDNIFSLVNIFNSKYPDVSLNNLVNHLMNINIVKSSKFINKKVSRYNHISNTIEFNTEQIEEGYDMKHIMMYELLNVITNNGAMTGFNQNDQFRALNAGYTEILANDLVGNDSDVTNLESEVISTNMLAMTIGPDVMFNAYFNNDASTLTQTMVEKGIDVEEINKAMNYGYDNPEYRNKVNPDELIVESASKSVIDTKTFEDMALYASMSQDKKAYQMCLENIKNAKNMENGIDRVATK